MIARLEMLREQNKLKGLLDHVIFYYLNLVMQRGKEVKITLIGEKKQLMKKYNP